MAENRFDVFEEHLPKKIFYKNSDIIREYGSNYEMFIKNSLLVKDKATFEKYKTSNLMTIKTQSGEKQVSKDLLLDVLLKNGLFKYLQTNLNNVLGIALRIDYFENGEILDTIQINRADFTSFIKALNPKELNYIQLMRIAWITKITPINVLKGMYGKSIHRVNIDGEECEFNVLDLISILEMNEQELEQFKNDEMCFKYRKEYMCYALNDFIKRERILEKYLLTDEVIKRYHDIEAQQIVDFEALNKNIKTNDLDHDGKSIIDRVIIDENFYNEIMKYSKNTYSNLEKAIYIYIRLCELLTFNAGVFANLGEHATKDVESIINITKDNNEVTSYEFLIIYTYLLRELGIRYTLDNKVLSGYQDSGYITFRDGEYIVEANAIQDIINSDMTNAKINAPLCGLKCLNKSQVSFLKFEELLYKIRMQIIETRENQVSFETALREYHEKYAESDLTFKDKIYVLLKDIARPDLKGVDAMSYQKKVFDNLFVDNPNVHIAFISSSINTYVNYTFAPLTLISIDLDEYTKYYIIDPTNQNIISTITKEELEELFESKDYAFISADTKDVSGLELRNGGNYVR